MPFSARLSFCHPLSCPCQSPYVLTLKLITNYYSFHLVSLRVIQVLLCIAAAVSLALGLYQDFGAPREHIACADGSENCLAPQVDWVEGVAILVAVSIVVIVGSVNDWQKEAQFKVLNAKKEDRTVTVVRDGQESMVNVKVMLPLSTNLTKALVSFLSPYHPGCGRWRYLHTGTWRDHPCRWNIPSWPQRSMR